MRKTSRKSRLPRPLSRRPRSRHRQFPLSRMCPWNPTLPALRQPALPRRASPPPMGNRQRPGLTSAVRRPFRVTASRPSRPRTAAPPAAPAPILEPHRPGQPAHAPRLALVQALACAGRRTLLQTAMPSTMGRTPETGQAMGRATVPTTARVQTEARFARPMGPLAPVLPSPPRPPGVSATGMPTAQRPRASPVRQMRAAAASHATAAPHVKTRGPMHGLGGAPAASRLWLPAPRRETASSMASRPGPSGRRRSGDEQG